jgi:hypothetical protein
MPPEVAQCPCDLARVNQRNAEATSSNQSMALMTPGLRFSHNDWYEMVVKDR